MLIEIKFDIGDDVYFINENKIETAQIVEFNIRKYRTMKDKRTDITYRFLGKNYKDLFFDEQVLFKTKQDLLDYLSSTIQ